MAMTPEQILAMRAQLTLQGVPPHEIDRKISEISMVPETSFTEKKAEQEKTTVSFPMMQARHRARQVQEMVERPPAELVAAQSVLNIGEPEKPIQLTEEELAAQQGAQQAPETLPEQPTPAGLAGMLGVPKGPISVEQYSASSGLDLLESASALQQEAEFESRQAQEEFRKAMMDRGAFEDTFRAEQDRYQTRLSAARERKQALIDRGVDVRGPLADKTNRVVATIASALGAMSAAYLGGPDRANQIIDQAIATDIAEQKERLSRGIDIENDEIVLARQEFEDTMQAEQAAMQMILDRYRLGMQHVGALTQSAQTQASMAQLYNGIEQRGLDMQFQAAESAKQRAFQTRLNNAQIRAKIAQKSAPLTTMPGFVRIDPGAATKEGDKKAREIATAYKGASSALDELIKIREEQGWIVPGIEKAFSEESRQAIKRAVAARAQMVNHIRNLQGMGARFERLEEQLIEQQIPQDPTGIGFYLDQLIQAKELLDSTTAAEMSVYGWSPSGQRKEVDVGQWEGKEID